MHRLLFLIFLALKYQSEAMNFSPFPNRVIDAPKHIKTRMIQLRSSYFGYSLVIRPTSIFVGAPRAQSPLESQSSINETGAVFRCSLATGSCSHYVLNDKGKEFQWLGGSMDGGTKDTDKLLVCAPRFFVPFKKFFGKMHGACYLVRDTVADATPLSDVSSIIPLPSIQSRMDVLGLSAHVTDDNSAFLIGAPVGKFWKGSVLVHQHRGGDEYVPKMLYPTHWKQKTYTYVGYALSSGYFSRDNRTSLLYVTTAPRSDLNSGEAYIFDVVGKSIRKLHVFLGEQLGEYFGYSVVTEDLNGDGLTDVVVSAPLNALGNYHDVGAIYVFINKGLLNFEKKIIRLPLSSGARFGSSLSRLGDINQDGYNDLAVGAPFAGNGAVFIFLGSEHGLGDEPSQRLDAPSREPGPYGDYMFGQALSRGSDIDGNGFNDLAIGAPGAEAVYLYRAYPVVKIHATVRSERREIRPDPDLTMSVLACYRLETPFKARQMQQQELTFRITIDEPLKRAVFAPMRTNEEFFQAQAGLNESCKHFEVLVTDPGGIFTPIHLQLHYELSKKIPRSHEAFCESCAVVDPLEPKYATETISFITGCAGKVCESDLQLSSKDVNSSFTLGTSEVFSMRYEITNSGEPAYVAQFKVTSSVRLPFAKVPGNCRVRQELMLCDLNGGLALARGDSESLTITFDVSQLSGHSLTIEAAVSSAGMDQNLKDNTINTTISLREEAEIDASGGPTDGQIALKEYPYSAEVSNSYEFKSHGPSVIDELTVHVYVPIAYRGAGSAGIRTIFNISSLQMQATHGSLLVPIKLYDQNNTLAKEYPLEDSSHRANRKRRELQQDPYRIMPDVKISDIQTKGDLPADRTLVLDCLRGNLTICVRSQMRVQLKPEQPINLRISFKVELSDFKDSFDYFVIFTNVVLFKKGDSTSIVIKRNIKPNVIFKYSETLLPPIWYIFSALITGHLLLAVMTYVLYKFRFFKRGKREQLKRLLEEQRSKTEKPATDCEGRQEEIHLERHSDLDN
ncbi:integrin alpha-PS5 [Drosophila mauritiana]|uniref:Integrin alpha-PS5 n=1 Tax=Drosophila mauritiana TaxID=7226 RepID=A0A6P8JL08_DROMA|nr:integrin alpha-PS5 [Drosophila mauritiana]